MPKIEDPIVTDRPPVITPTITPADRDQNAKPVDWAVLLHNDATTGFNFVVDCLSEVFSVNRADATRMMMIAHQSGKAVVRLTSRDVAETLVAVAEAWVASNEDQFGMNPGQPSELRFTSEKA